MKNYHAPADGVQLTAPYAVVPGDGMLVGSLFSVASKTAASGALTDAVTEGMFYLPTVSAETAAEGATAFWDAANRRVSASTGVAIGHFSYAKLAGETSTRVRLASSALAVQTSALVSEAGNVGAVTPGLSRALLANYQAAIIAAGSTITPHELNALRDPLDKLMRSSVWPKLRELWVPCGADLAGARVKLKSDATGGTSMTAIGAPAYAQATGVTGNGADMALNTGFNPTTAGLTSTDWGFCATPLKLTASGVLAGVLTGTATYIAYSVGLDSKIGNVSPGTHNQMPRPLAVQFSGGSAQAWMGGWNQSSAVGSGALPNSAITLLAGGGGLWSSQSVAGYAVWSPSLTAAEMLALTQFFDAANSNLLRLVWQGSSVADGDSNTIASVGGITTAQRWPNIVALALGHTEDNQGIANTTMSASDNGGAGNRWVTNYKVSRSVARAGNLYTVMLGTNDDRYAVPLAAFAADYEAWLVIQLAAGIPPQSIVLMAPVAATDALSSYARQAQFRDVIRALAVKYKTGYFDTLAFTLGQASYFQGDLLHISVAGHAAIAQALIAYIATSQTGGASISLPTWTA